MDCESYTKVQEMWTNQSSNGAVVTGAILCFHFGLKTPYPRNNEYLIFQTSVQTTAREDASPSEKVSAIILSHVMRLLNVYKHWCLYLILMVLARSVLMKVLSQKGVQSLTSGQVIVESDCYCVTMAQCSSIDVESNQKSVFLPSKLGEHCRKKGGKNVRARGVV